MALSTFVPKVTYNTSTTFSFSLPMRLWTPISKTIGGQNVSTAGIPEAFMLRRDDQAKLTLRFTEDEWSTGVGPWIAFQQQNPGTPFTFWFQTSPAVPVSGFSCYLDKPVMGEDITPKRGDYIGTYELEIVLRAVTPGASLYVKAY